MTEVMKSKRSAVMKATSLDAKKRTLDATISTNQVDRDGEIVEPSAFKDRIDTFMDNPVFLWMHNPEKVVGNVTDVDIKKDRIDAKLQWREEGRSELSDEIFSLYEDGTLKTFSIGFRVFKMEFSEKEDGSPEPPKITDAELYEVSAVSIPANPGAVAKILKHGIGERLADLRFTDTETLERALALSRNIVERRLLGEAVPADQWALVQKLQVALLSAKRAEEHEGEDEINRALADLHQHIQRTFELK